MDSQELGSSNDVSVQDFVSSTVIYSIVLYIDPLQRKKSYVERKKVTLDTCRTWTRLAPSLEVRF